MNFLDFLDSVNLIDRLEGWALGMYHGGAHVFTLDRSKVTGKDAEDLLKRYKVRVFGRRITSKHALFAVPKKQAAWAEYILLRAGIAPLGKPVNPKNTTWARRHPAGQAPPAWKDRRP